ncbi:MAG: hypothetical protein ABI835_02405 [Chloroflexota bacterium]
MARTVVALYDEFETARNAVEALVDAGFTRSDISLVANNAAGAYDSHFEDGTYVYDDEDVSAGEGAGFGAVVGALVGLGVALIPGVGPVLAAGPLAAALMAGIGAASGAVTGGVVAGLVDFGVPEEHAETYAEGIRRGGTLVTVHIMQDEWADRAQNVLNRFDPIDLDDRTGEWRSSGWSGYDENAQPYTAEDIRTQNQTASAMGSSTTMATMPTTTTFADYTTYEPRFRMNYDRNYANSGYDYNQFDPAFRYGYTLATDTRYRDYDWDRLEPEAQAYWDKNYPGTWERVKNGIRDAWDEVTGR